MSEKFTPGPWFAIQHPYGAMPWVVRSEATRTPKNFIGDKVAASILSEHDARLIAAAPDLLAALDDASEFVFELFYSGTYIPEDRVKSAMRKYRAAIAKARGQ